MGTEYIEDVQLRSLKHVRVFDETAFKRVGADKAVFTKWLATSSRYGVTVIIGPNNGIYTCQTSTIHQLGAREEGEKEVENFPFRAFSYHDAQNQIYMVDCNCDGTVFAFVVQTQNGPFVELFDALCFDSRHSDMPFPLLRVRLSNDNRAQLTVFEWNPESPNVFATISSDNSLNTIQFQFSADNTSFSLLGSLTMQSPVNCLSWSPKGKQLSVGDFSGKIYQLKPDLSVVRHIDPPESIGSSQGPYSCVGLCWTSTTEWLTAYSNGQQFAWITQLEVKKQQPAKWCILGDSIDFPSQTIPNQIRFCPILGWKMAFVFVANNSRIELLLSRGEKWVQFENEIFDIQLPLNSQKRDTFPIGYSLDFSSSLPVHLEKDGSKVNPKPIVYILNTSGVLLPYAVVPLNTTQYLELTKTPESYSMKNARFGKPSKMYEAGATRSATARVLDNEPKESSPITKAQTQQPTTVAIEANDEQMVKNKAEDEFCRKIEVREKSLEKTIGDYAKSRNFHARKTDTLRELRCEVERCASTLSLENLEEFAEIQRDVQIAIDGANFDLERLHATVLKKVELMKEIKLLHQELVSDEKRGSRRLAFDTRKKIELTQNEYERILEGFARVKIMFEKIVERNRGNVVSMNISRRLEPVDPVEQKKINEITENISRLITKLGSRITFLQRQLSEMRRLGKLVKMSPIVSARGESSITSRKLEIPRTTEHCTVQLQQLVLETSELKSRLNPSTTQSADDQLRKEQRRRLRTLMTAHSQQNVPIRQIPPLQLISTERLPQKSASESVAEQSVSSDKDLSLSTRIMQVMTTPNKTPKVSVGTQSPNFDAIKPKKTTPQKGIAKSPATTPLAVAGLRHSKLLTSANTLPATQNHLNTTPKISTQANDFNLGRSGNATSTLKHFATSPTTVSVIQEAKNNSRVPPKSPSTTVVSTQSFTALANATPETTRVTFAVTNQSNLLGPTTEKSIENRGTPQIATALPISTADSSVSASSIATTATTTTFSTNTAQTKVLPSLSTTSVSTVPHNTTPNVVPSVGSAPSTNPGGSSAEMMEDDTATMGGSGFGGFGLGSSTPINASRSAFGSIPVKNPAQQSAGEGLSLFGGGAGNATKLLDANKPTPTGGLFSPMPSTAAAQNSGGFGAAGFGTSVTAAHSFGTSPFSSGGASQQKSLFGGGATFGSTSAFAPQTTKSMFGGSPFSGTGTAGFGTGSAAITPVTGTPNIATGFAAFANKSSAFGQLAKNASPPQQQQPGTSLFGGGQTPAFSSFGGAATSSGFISSPGTDQSKSSAFTTFRK